MDNFVIRTKRVRIEVPRNQNQEPSSAARDTNRSVHDFHSPEESNLIYIRSWKKALYY